MKRCRGYTKELTSSRPGTLRWRAGTGGPELGRRRDMNALRGDMRIPGQAGGQVDTRMIPGGVSTTLCPALTANPTVARGRTEKMMMINPAANAMVGGENTATQM